MGVGASDSRRQQHPLPPELGGTSFQQAGLGVHSELFSAPIPPAEVGWLDLVAFFPLIYLSPGAGLSFPQDRPAGTLSPLLLLLSGEVSRHLCKDFRGSEGVKPPSNLLFSLKKEKKIAHSTQFSARFRLKFHQCRGEV